MSADADLDRYENSVSNALCIEEGEYRLSVPEAHELVASNYDMVKENHTLGITVSFTAEKLFDIHHGHILNEAGLIERDATIKKIQIENIDPPDYHTLLASIVTDYGIDKLTDDEVTKCLSKYTGEGRIKDISRNGYRQLSMREKLRERIKRDNRPDLYLGNLVASLTPSELREREISLKQQASIRKRLTNEEAHSWDVKQDEIKLAEVHFPPTCRLEIKHDKDGISIYVWEELKTYGQN